MIEKQMKNNKGNKISRLLTEDMPSTWDFYHTYCLVPKPVSEQTIRRSQNSHKNLLGKRIRDYHNLERPSGWFSLSVAESWIPVPSSQSYQGTVNENTNKFKLFWCQILAGHIYLNSNRIKMHLILWLLLNLIMPIIFEGGQVGI